MVLGGAVVVGGGLGEEGLAVRSVPDPNAVGRFEPGVCGAVVVLGSQFGVELVEIDDLDGPWVGAVDQAVVSSAEKGAVVAVGSTAEDPLVEVMCRAACRGLVASGEDAATVASCKSASLSG